MAQARRGRNRFSELARALRTAQTGESRVVLSSIFPQRTAPGAAAAGAIVNKSEEYLRLRILIGTLPRLQVRKN
jgi:hypothetical protein